MWRRERITTERVWTKPSTTTVMDCELLCETILDPVCGTDNIVYANACFGNCANVSYTPGCCPTVMEKCLQQCSDIYAPVCNSTHLFLNACRAACHVATGLSSCNVASVASAADTADTTIVGSFSWHTGVTIQLSIVMAVLAVYSLYIWRSSPANASLAWAHLLALGGWLGLSEGSCYVMPMILAYGLLTYMVWLFELVRLRLRKVWLNSGKTSFLRGVMYWVGPALWLIVGQVIEMSLGLDNLSHTTAHGCWSRGKMAWLFVYVPIATLYIGIVGCVRLLSRVHPTGWVRPGLYAFWFLLCWSLVPVIHVAEQVQWLFATSMIAYAVTYLTAVRFGPTASSAPTTPSPGIDKVDMDWDENMY